jgi:hypothetical protein
MLAGGAAALMARLARPAGLGPGEALRGVVGVLLARDHALNVPPVPNMNSPCAPLDMSKRRGIAVSDDHPDCPVERTTRPAVKRKPHRRIDVDARYLIVVGPVVGGSPSW